MIHLRKSQLKIYNVGKVKLAEYFSKYPNDIDFAVSPLQAARLSLEYLLKHDSSAEEVLRVMNQRLNKKERGRVLKHVLENKRVGNYEMPMLKILESGDFTRVYFRELIKKYRN